MDQAVSKQSRVDESKKPDNRVREALRKRLLEMIRRNEELRREQAK